MSLSNVHCSLFNTSNYDVQEVIYSYLDAKDVNSFGLSCKLNQEFVNYYLDNYKVSFSTDCLRSLQTINPWKFLAAYTETDILIKQLVCSQRITIQEDHINEMNLCELKIKKSNFKKDLENNVVELKNFLIRILGTAKNTEDDYVHYPSNQKKAIVADCLQSLDNLQQVEDRFYIQALLKLPHLKDNDFFPHHLNIIVTDILNTMLTVDCNIEDKYNELLSKYFTILSLINQKYSFSFTKQFLSSYYKKNPSENFIPYIFSAASYYLNALTELDVELKSKWLKELADKDMHLQCKQKRENEVRLLPLYCFGIGKVDESNPYQSLEFSPILGEHLVKKIHQIKQNRPNEIINLYLEKQSQYGELSADQAISVLECFEYEEDFPHNITFEVSKNHPFTDRHAESIIKLIKKNKLLHYLRLTPIVMKPCTKSDILQKIEGHHKIEESSHFLHFLNQ